MSTARRIAFVCPRFAAGGTVGGAETLLKNLAERAAAASARWIFSLPAPPIISPGSALPPRPPARAQHDRALFPVAENRDLAAFLRAQDLICRGADYTAGG